MWPHNFIVGSILLGLGIGMFISTVIMVADFEWREPKAWWWWGFRALFITAIIVAVCLGMNLMIRFHGAT